MGVKLPSKKPELPNELSSNPNVVGGSNSINPKLGRKKYVVVTMALILVAGLIIFALHKNQKINPQNTSCANDKAFIARYNEVMQKRGATKLKEIAAELEKKDTTHDATCKYILMMLQYGDTTNNGEVDTYKQLKQLEKQGQNVSNDIKDGVDLQSLEKFFQQKIDNESKNYYGEG